MRFLICLDGTEFSEAAIEPVRELAGAASAEVHLLRVLVVDHPEFPEPWTGTPEEAERVLDPELSARRARTERELARIARHFPGSTHVEVLVADSAARAIIHHAEHDGVDLIAMATHSRRELAGERLGSTAESVTSSGAAPVLLVHPREAESISTDALARGTPVFTSDRTEVGQVAEVRGEGFRVTRGDGEDVWFRNDALAAIQGGRALLHYREAEYPEHTIPAPQ